MWFKLLEHLVISARQQECLEKYMQALQSFTVYLAM